ncbi:MAG: hypothetical protein QXG35_00420 [Nitrososphaerota archaeon]
MRRVLRRISQPASPLPYQSAWQKVLANERDHAVFYIHALSADLELARMSPSAIETGIGVALVLLSSTLLLASLILKYQTWPLALMLLGIYAIASAIKRRLISGRITFIILLLTTFADILLVSAGWLGGSP